MAKIVTQSYSTPPASLPSSHDQSLIPRLPQEKPKNVSFKEIKAQFFKGPKKPPLPKNFSTIHVLPLKVLCEQVVLPCRAKEEDFEFIKSSLTNDKVPDCNGFNTQKTRDFGQGLKAKSKVVFTLLLDRTPSDPSTMLPAVAEAARITHEAGQSVTVFTADQQLYRVALDISWTYEIRFTNFVLRIGGMHWFMSFVGCIGVLMKNSRLLSWLKSDFSVLMEQKRCLQGKSFP